MVGQNQADEHMAAKIKADERGASRPTTIRVVHELGVLPDGPRVQVDNTAQRATLHEQNLIGAGGGAPIVGEARVITGATGEGATGDGQRAVGDGRGVVDPRTARDATEDPRGTPPPPTSPLDKYAAAIDAAFTGSTPDAFTMPDDEDPSSAAQTNPQATLSPEQRRLARYREARIPNNAPLPPPVRGSPDAPGKYTTLAYVPPLSEDPPGKAKKVPRGTPMSPQRTQPPSQKKDDEDISCPS